MVLEQSTLQVAYVVSVVMSIALCTVLWRHREKTGAIPLFCYVFSGFLWGVIQLANITIGHYALSSALLRSLYLGIALGLAALFVFALEYTGRERYLGPKTYLALSLHPLFIIVFASIDPGGHFFGTIEPDAASPVGVSPDYGIAMLIHLVYAYALTIGSVLMFVDMLYRTRSLYRGQSVALIGGAILPALAPLGLIFGLIEFDASPIAIPIASVLFTVAIVRYRLIDLVPIARDRVIDTINDGVFVVDGDDRLIDVNPEGRRILSRVGIDDDSLVGSHFPSLFEQPELRRQYESVKKRGEEASLEVTIGANHFQVTGTPIDDGRDRHVGWLMIAHDITQRKRRENRLERQNERLDQFANLVSHDLRNPLTVASGYLDLARETDENAEYLERIDAAHDRMETIIDDVLTLAREGADVTDPEPVDLTVLAERAWESVDTGDATLEVRSSAPILADPDRVRRLLENLFRNAVEHGSTSSQDAVEHGPANPGVNTVTDESDLLVTVGISRDDDPGGVAFYVEDNGPGIPPDHSEAIFEDGYTTGEEGTGFGLSIVQQIAGAHGWSVDVADGETDGARFEFTGVDRGDATEPTAVEPLASSDGS